MRNWDALADCQAGYQALGVLGEGMAEACGPGRASPYRPRWCVRVFVAAAGWAWACVVRGATVQGLCLKSPRLPGGLHVDYLVDGNLDPALHHLRDWPIDNLRPHRRARGRGGVVRGAHGRCGAI